MKNTINESSNDDILKLTWRNLSATVSLAPPSIFKRMRKRKYKYPTIKSVLTDVSGVAYSSSMLAILGESGSGKTTLLNILMGKRLKNMKIIGSIKLNGQDVNIKSIAAYVEQTDIFIPNLTVYEHLYFYATLVLDENNSIDDTKKRVNEIINSFSLDECSNTRIGSLEKNWGISGGQRRRLSIASQLISNPRIIFLDEPTSGLDSFTAESVIQILKRLSQLNCAIITTIHQPSSQIFAQFDRLILLAQGKMVYCGLTSECMSFFSKAGFTCPINFNPADFFIDTIAIKVDGEKNPTNIINKLITNQSELEIEQQEHDQLIEESYNMTELKKRKVSIGRQFRSLIARSWRSAIREPALVKAKLIQTIVMAIFFGLIYLKLEYKIENINNFAGAIFGFLSSLSFGAANSVIFVIPAEILVFRREHSRSLYDTWIYYITKTLVDIPIFVLMPSVYLLIAYFMIGFNPTIACFFTFWLIFTLVNLTASSLGYLISVLASNFQIASSLAPPLLVIMMLFGGFFVRSINIPIYFAWIRYISWYSYAYDALISAQFTDVKLNLSGQSIIPDGNVSIVNGSYAITLLGINNYGLLINAASLFGMLIGYRVIALCVLVMKTRFQER